jgi:hypothetical protein
MMYLLPIKFERYRIISGPVGIQTPNLLIRSQMLYSVELRALNYFRSGKFKRINSFAKRSFLADAVKNVFLRVKKKSMRKITFLFILFTAIVTYTQAQEKTKKVYRPDIPGSFLIDFGFNFGLSKPQNFNQGFWGSRTLNIYYQYPVKLGNNHFSYNPGIGFAFERFKFTNHNTLFTAPASDGTYTLDDPTLGSSGISTLQNAGIKKSMLVANYFDIIPVEIRFDTKPKDLSSSFNIAVGVRVGALIESHTKIKYSQNGVNAVYKDKQQHGLNPFRYGIYTRVGAGNFNFFWFYNLSTYFATNKGPHVSQLDASSTTMNTMTFGISLNGF